MNKMMEFMKNAIESYKTSMNHYGEARIIISESLINNNISFGKTVNKNN